jgi:mannose-6-phosphate isomerase-like protein (cupin superfamily)
MKDNGRYSYNPNIDSERISMRNERRPSAFYRYPNNSPNYDNNERNRRQHVDHDKYDNSDYRTNRHYYNTTKDYGPEPFVVNINEAAKRNNNFRTALWTGEHLQLTLMSINVGEDIGLECHPDLDQFIRIEEGQGIVLMGDNKNRLNFKANVSDDFAFIIPAGTWHNLINTGCNPLKLYSIYAPPQHPWGTIHETKADAEAAEHNH